MKTHPCGQTTADPQAQRSPENCSSKLVAARRGTSSRPSLSIFLPSLSGRRVYACLPGVRVVPLLPLSVPYSFQPSPLPHAARKDKSSKYVLKTKSVGVALCVSPTISKRKVVMSAAIYPRGIRDCDAPYNIGQLLCSSSSER